MNYIKRDLTVIIAFLAFVGLGLSGGLLGLAWPSMQVQFGLPLDGVSILFIAQTATYALAGFTIGRLMARWGSGPALLIGALALMVCLFGIALSATWLAVIAFTLVWGVGSGIVDAGLNLYIATYHSPRQMAWLHGSFGIGITIGPLIMTFALERNLPWQSGYALVGVALLAIVFLFAVTQRQWRTEGFRTVENRPVRRESFRSTLSRPVVWLSMATFILYVGTEIGIGQWTYVLLTQSRGMAPGVAGPWVSIYWGAFTGGRILFGFIANRFAIPRVLRVAMLGMILGAFLFWWDPSSLVSLWGLAIVGFAQAPVFPMLMSDTPARVGAEHAENTISLQMGAVGVGSAILPGWLGTLGNTYGLETMAGAFVVFAFLVFGVHELTRLRWLAQPAAGPAA